MTGSNKSEKFVPDAEGLPVIINGKAYPDIRRNPLDDIAVTSFALGILLGIFVGLLTFTQFRNFNVYIIALSLFHFLEFYVTAKVNPGKVNSDSFLLNNGIGYLGAHMFGVLECLVESIFFPNMKKISNSWVAIFLTIIGVILILLGQLSRSMAMYQAGKSFSHILKTEKLDDHTLVTTGIYGYLRHPSYFGFFWWAIGTQLLLLNPIALIVFVGVLWSFFNKRILIEEKYLIQFFGEQYINYKKRVKVWIPLID